MRRQPSNGHTRQHWQSHEYQCWSMMKQRCFNPKATAFRYYGARGIVVCEAWRESFPAFLASVGPAPSLEHSLDRYPNREGNYEPGNVRWATRQQQLANSNFPPPTRTLAHRAAIGAALKGKPWTTAQRAAYERGRGARARRTA